MLRILLAVIGVFLYSCLALFSFTGFQEKDFEFILDGLLFFIRHVILFSGFFPLITFMSWIFFSTTPKMYLKGLLWVVLLIFSHYVVAAFSAHDDDGYMVSQLIETLLCLTSLWRLKVNYNQQRG